MVSIQNGRCTPIPFTQMVDPISGRAKVRMVDITSQSYQIARRYMIRLSSEDFENPATLGRYAAIAGLLPEAFQSRFQIVSLNSSETRTIGGAS